MAKHIHIVAFDVPYPPTYGGIIDLYFQLKAFHQTGVKVTYHCFYYDRNNPPTERLKLYADKVYYYHRKKHVGKLVMNKLPFVVATRNDINLLKNLLEDQSPIIFSGLQSCYFLNHPDLKKRLKIVRTHNIEHLYYKGLAAVERNKLKKQYFLWEAKKLEKFECELNHAQAILSIAKMDLAHFSQYAPTHHSPPYFRFKSRKNNFDETPLYGLFQGNLSVGENINTVKFIVDHIVPKTKHHIVIAGKNPSDEVINLCSAHDNLQLIANPEQEKMNELIENAQVNLLFTSQQTGIKLKLLHALAIGKHIIINDKMDDEGLFKPLCHIENDPEKIEQTFEKLMSTYFSEDRFKSRQELFKATFDNSRNAKGTLHLLESLE
jgi:hypothetical protein